MRREPTHFWLVKEVADSNGVQGFVFDDLQSLTTDDICILIANSDPATMVLALKAASESMREAFFAVFDRAIPKDRAWEWDAATPMRPVTFAECEAAQNSIIQLALSLAQAGSIAVVSEEERNKLIKDLDNLF
jgi:flagellar motor switch protein FliG